MNAYAQTATSVRPVSQHSGTMSPWLILIWKEWHEHKWSTVSVTSLCLLGLTLSKGDATDFGIAVLISLAGALFLAMRVLSGERDEGSLNFVNSLPLPSWKLGLARLGVSSMLCITPLLISGVVIQYVFPLFLERAASSETWLLVLLSCGLCLSLFLWITASACRQPTQLRVGLLGIIVMTCWFAIGTALTTLRGHHGITWVEKIAWIGPNGWGAYATVPTLAPESSFLLCQFFTLALLFWASVIGYGIPLHRSGGLSDSSHVIPLGLPRRSAKSAITWLQIRESLPLCGAGAVMIITLSFFSLVLFTPTTSVTKMASMVESTAFLFGIPWMIVVAVGTFVPNLKNGLHTFWRSRPIDVKDWYWSKFWLGAAVSLLSIHLPVILMVGVTQKLAWGEPAANCMSYLLAPLMHLMVYSIGVLAACGIRILTQAGALSLAIAVLCVGLPVLPESSLAVFNYGRARESLTHFFLSRFDMAHIGGFLPLLVTIIFITYITAHVAAFLVRKDKKMTTD